MCVYVCTYTHTHTHTWTHCSSENFIFSRNLDILFLSPHLPPIIKLSQFSGSVVSNSLRPHGLQHARIPCPSPTPGACSNSCLSSWWCHPTISSSVIPFSSCLQSFPASEYFSSESILLIRWLKYWSFSFSIIPSREHPGLISFISVLYYFQIFNIFDIFQDANNFSITICSSFSGI